MTTCTPSTTLAATIESGSGVNVFKCYQCKRCSSGCPVAPYAEMHPARIMRAVQLGQADMIFDDKFLWLCTGCETCTSRCPQSLDVEAVIDELKSIALRESRVPSGAPYANLVKLNVDSIKRWGRLFEMELLMRDKLTRPSSMFDDVGMGLKMMRKGKLSLLPARGADKMAVDRMAKAAEAINRARAHQRPQGGQR
ncbi:MAG: 4Fe-4S dicluster domain-containing protein [Thermoleophilia bacterium]